MMRKWAFSLVFLLAIAIAIVIAFFFPEQLFLLPLPFVIVGVIFNPLRVYIDKLEGERRLPELIFYWSISHRMTSNDINGRGRVYTFRSELRISNHDSRDLFDLKFKGPGDMIEGGLIEASVLHKQDSIEQRREIEVIHGENGNDVSSAHDIIIERNENFNLEYSYRIGSVTTSGVIEVMPNSQEINLRNEA